MASAYSFSELLLPAGAWLPLRGNASVSFPSICRPFGRTNGSVLAPCEPTARFFHRASCQDAQAFNAAAGPPGKSLQSSMHHPFFCGRVVFSALVHLCAPPRPPSRQTTTTIRGPYSGSAGCQLLVAVLLFVFLFTGEEMSAWEGFGTGMVASSGAPGPASGRGGREGRGAAICGGRHARRFPACLFLSEKVPTSDGAFSSRCRDMKAPCQKNAAPQMSPKESRPLVATSGSAQCFKCERCILCSVQQGAPPLVP